MRTDRRPSPSRRAGQAKQLVDHALAVEDERIQERATFARKVRSLPRFLLLAKESSSPKLAQLSEVQAALASSVASSALQRKLQQVDYDQLEKQAQLLAGKVGEGQRSGVKDSEAATTNGYQYVYGVTQQKIENQQLKLDVGFLQRRVSSARARFGGSALVVVSLADPRIPPPPQLRNSEAQVTRLTTELRHLRPLALHGAPLLTYDTELILPPAPSNPRPRPRPPTLGDAAAEHLLLAGRTLSHARRIRRVPLSRALVEKAGEVVEGGWSDEWGRGVDELDVLEEEVGKDKGRERGEQAPRPRGKRRRVEVEAMGAGGGDWDFGLGGGEEEIDVDGFLANGGGGGGGGAGLTRGISALDVLAQASASQESQDQHEPTPPLVEAASHSYATRPTTLAASQATAAQMAKLQAEAGEMGGEGEGQVAGGGGGGGGGWEPARQQYIKVRHPSYGLMSRRRNKELMPPLGPMFCAVECRRG